MMRFIKYTLTILMLSIMIINNSFVSALSLKKTKDVRDSTMIPSCDIYVEQIYPKLDLLSSFADVRKMDSKSLNTFETLKAFDGILYKVPKDTTIEGLNSIIILSQTLDNLLKTGSLKEKNGIFYDFVYKLKNQIDEMKNIMKKGEKESKTMQKISLVRSIWDLGSTVIGLILKDSAASVINESCRSVLYQENKLKELTIILQEYKKQEALFVNTQKLYDKQRNMLINAGYSCRVGTTDQVVKALKNSNKRFCDNANNIYNKLNKIQQSAKDLEKNYNMSIDDGVGILLSKGMEVITNTILGTPIENKGNNFFNIETYKTYLDNTCQTKDSFDITKRPKRSTKKTDDIQYCINTISMHGTNGDFDNWNGLRDLGLKRLRDRQKLAQSIK